MKEYFSEELKKTISRFAQECERYLKGTLANPVISSSNKYKIAWDNYVFLKEYKDQVIREVVRNIRSGL